MTASLRRGAGGVVRSCVVVTCAAAVLAAPGCSRPLLQRAIAARGGALTSLSREANAEVHEGFPGSWAWRFDYRVPDSLRWTIETYGEEQSIAYDGRTVRYYLGEAAIGNAPAALGDFRSEVRWMAVTTLDAVAGNAALTSRELTRDELPPGVVSGLAVTYRDDGARYALYFDDDDLLVAAEGPVAVPTIASGRMHAVFSDFRDTAGYLLPYRGRYTIDARPLFDEQVVRYVPNDPALTAASFRGPPLASAR
jgi:hypothetical protein